ncbi:MAG TPA: ABC transporter ATP-binding protein [Burkholderiaceae bacterium]|nr:ABC transporter ATP-binding protein [Burkholderiaceae bacterium]
MSGAVTSAAAPPWALELNGVGRSFGGLRAVNDVRLRVAAGSTHVVIGPNGAGKTTLFGLISGEIALSSGSVRMLGTDMSRWSATRRALGGLGRTYQITNVMAGLTVEENVLLALRGKRSIKYSLFGDGRPNADEDEQLSALLAKCGIAGHRRDRAGAMSYGRQRQLELAIALANSPRVLLLDEPAAGLSPAERGPMADIIRQLPDDLTVLLIEHDMELALGLADQVTCLYYGEVLAEGSPAAIRENEQVQAVYFGTAAHA